MAWREGGKVGCRVRVRTRHKFAANGSEAGQIGLVRRGESQESAPKQDTNWCADSLAWRKGV